MARALVIVATVALMFHPWSADCSGPTEPGRQRLDTVDAAIDYKRSLTELIGKLEDYLVTSRAAFEKAKALREAGVVTEAEVASHAASVDATTRKIAATRAKLAEVDAAITGLGGTPAKAPPTANRVSADGIQSLDVPFDATVVSLAPNYQGHQLSALSELISASVTRKGEFESTQQHRDRVRAKLPAGILALRAEPDVQSEVELKFDADRKVMILEVTAEGPTILRRTYFFTAVSNRKLYLVASRELPGFLIDGSRARWSTEIELQPDEARLLKPRLRVLFIGRLPLGDNPEDRDLLHSSNGPFIGFSIEQIWLYDVTTGTVHAKKGLINATRTSSE